MTENERPSLELIRHLRGQLEVAEAEVRHAEAQIGHWSSVREKDLQDIEELRDLLELIEPILEEYTP